MTRKEYIEQLPKNDNAYGACTLRAVLDSDCYHEKCSVCLSKEATINGQPAPYLFACPVKPGQTVYIPYKSVIDGKNYGINTEIVGTITFYEDSWYAHFAYNLGGFNEAFWMGDVFPSRESAEKRIEELKS